MRRPHPGGTRPSLVLLPPSSYKSATGRERVCPRSCPSRPLIIRKGTYLRPALLCARGRVCPLSGLSRPLINNKKACLPAFLSVRGDASVPCLASLVLLLIIRNPACGRPVCPWGTRLSPVLLLSSSYQSEEALHAAAPSWRDASVPCLASSVFL